MENNIPLVLIGAPVSSGKDYILDEWMDYVENLSYPNKLIYLVDNSEDETYHQKIIDRGIECDYYPPEDKPFQQILCDCQNMIRAKALRIGAGYLAMNECDVFGSQNWIEHLMAMDEPVISGTYFLRFGKEMTLCISHYDNWYLNDFMLIPMTEAFFIMDGSVKVVGSTGIGLTLFKRWLIELIPFRWQTINQGIVKQRAEKTTFSDTFFYVDCNMRGIEPKVDTSLLCRHERKNWEESSEFIKRLPEKI